MNYPLIISLIAIIFAQVIKYPIALLMKKDNVSLDLITSTGGMPSSHSAAVASLITSLAIEYGIDSPYVAIATIFGVIVMFDSMGVRRQSGEQGIVLDLLMTAHISELKAQKASQILKSETTHPSLDKINLEEYDHMIINKYLGHTPLEVIAGVCLGFIVSFVCHILIIFYIPL